jgi:uncharacterized membrane protein (UPF0127 family)
MTLPQPGYVFEFAQLHTQAGVCQLRLRVARSFWARFRGLMLAPPLPAGDAFLIRRCASVHCMFMRYAIDVVYVDDDGRVLQCVRNLRPWRMSVANRRAKITKKHSQTHTVELAVGSIDRYLITQGDRFNWVANG